MFTGIIEETGEVKSLFKGENSSVIEVQGSVIFDDLKKGESVAVNGVCLTVTEIEKHTFKADIMNETLMRTNLGKLIKGSKVNLERAMPVNGRFGGHIVTGHIDGQGIILRIERDGNSLRYMIKAESKITDLIVEKGSVAIDGISLTVTGVSGNCFGVSVVPFTMQNTVLLNRRMGSEVNIENDILGKYVLKLTETTHKDKTKSCITKEFLEDIGYRRF